jgi:hypothetical protein
MSQSSRTRTFVVFYVRAGVTLKGLPLPSDVEPVATIDATDRDLVWESMVGQGAETLGIRTMDRGDAVLDLRTGRLSIRRSRGWREIQTGR